MITDKILCLFCRMTIQNLSQEFCATFVNYQAKYIRDINIGKIACVRHTSFYATGRKGKKNLGMVKLTDYFSHDQADSIMAAIKSVLQFNSQTRVLIWFVRSINI